MTSPYPSPGDRSHGLHSPHGQGFPHVGQQQGFPRHLSPGNRGLGNNVPYCAGGEMPHPANGSGRAGGSPVGHHPGGPGSAASNSIQQILSSPLQGGATSTQGHQQFGPHHPHPSSGAPGGEISNDPKDLQHAMSDQELTALLSRQDIATSLAEDLLAQFSHPSHGQDASKTAGHLDGAPSQHSKGAPHPGSLTIDPFTGMEKPSPFSPTASVTRPLSHEGAHSPRTHSKPIVGPANTEAGAMQQRLSSVSKADLDWNNELKVEVDAKQGVKPEMLSPSNMSINMSASQIIAACKGLGLNCFLNGS